MIFVFSHIIYVDWSDIMGFKIEKEEYVNKTFRMEKKLVDELEIICNQKNISLNKLVVKCIKYALDNLEDEEDCA